MIHYHGTPITPNSELEKMAGRHFCVSYANPQNLKACLRIGQSVMLDNGAFSAYTKGIEFDPDGFYRWIEPVLTPPHWGVIPDKIGGTVEDQHYYLARHPKTIGYQTWGAVWHLNLPFSHLKFLCNAYPIVCLGSSGEYWNVGSESWRRRMDETFNELVRYFGRVPYLHGMRMLGQASGRWPLASADSTNVAQNYKRDTGCAECKARVIDRVNPSGKWDEIETQRDLFSVGSI
jgi:hypothetical protein